MQSSPCAKPLRVFFVSTSYPRDASDWRGIFMAHISTALAQHNEIRLIQWAPPGLVDQSVEIGATSAEEAWLSQLMQRGGISHWLRSNPMSGAFAAFQLLNKLRAAYRRQGGADLYHVNWLQCALPLPANGKPALITVLGNDMRLLRLPGMRMMLRRMLHGRAVAICPNADWMRPELEKAFGDMAMVRTVPFGIDPRWYDLKRRFEANAIPKWLCVSRLTAGKLGPLFNWTAPFFSSGGAELHLFGPMQEQVEVPPWVHWHGPVSPEALCDIWFPQAQGLITLSQHAEGRPQVMLEAMASGLPIIASQLPAHDDLLCKGGGVSCATAGETQAALEAMCDPQENRLLGQLGRARMRNEIGTWNNCVQRYIALYRELLGDSNT